MRISHSLRRTWRGPSRLLDWWPREREDVLELLSSGASFDEILVDYPYLEREDILAAIEYAAHLTDHAVLGSP